MRSSDRRLYVKGYGYIYADNIIPVIQQGIKVEVVNLEINSILGNDLECLAIKRRIAKAKIFSLVLSGDLPT